jgi:Zn-dependent metalloprotease
MSKCTLGLVGLTLLFGGCADEPSDEIRKHDDEALFVARDQAARDLGISMSFAVLYERYGSMLSSNESWRLHRIEIDEIGMAHTVVQQVYDNIPVWGGQAIVHLNSDGTFDMLTDDTVRDVSVVTHTELLAKEAIDFAVEHAGGWERVSKIADSDLHIVRTGSGDHLAYRIRIEQLNSGTPAIPVVFVDAHTGEFVMQYDDLKTARNRNTYDANNGTSLPGSLRCTEANTTCSDNVEQQAHDHAGIAYNYYSVNHGRDSFNNAGAIITSTVHYDTNYVNAHWNGSQLKYGDGDGSTSGPLVSLDIVAHEFSHAVTEHSANLIYSGESGAINEATSDIFAAAAEAWSDGSVSGDTWKMGEDTWTPAIAGDALRYMNNPTQDGSSRDHYSTLYRGIQDNGGVHRNSGIANLFFYLCSQGGSHPNPSLSVGTVTGAGIADCARIWYRALTLHMTASTNFASARTATESACNTLFGAGSSQCAAVGAAWCEVGLGFRKLLRAWDQPESGWVGYSLDVEDVTGDGRADLVWNQRGTINRTYVARSNGDGTFTRVLTAWDQPESGWGGYSLHVKDVTGDGRADLVWNERGTTNRTYVARSNGNGTFTRVLTAWDQPESGWGGYSLHVKDVTGDGRADLVWNERGTTNRTYVARSNGNGTFTRVLTAWDQPESGWSGYSLDVEDVTGDGRADLVWNERGTTNRTYVVRSNGDGTFTRVLTAWDQPESGWSGYSLHMKDVTGDGRADLVWNQRGSINRTYVATQACTTL